MVGSAWYIKLPAFSVELRAWEYLPLVVGEQGVEKKMETLMLLGIPEEHSLLTRGKLAVGGCGASSMLLPTY